MADNLSDAIGNILSDPEAMKKISQLSKSLGLGNSEAESPPQSGSGNFPDMSMLSKFMRGEEKTESSTHSNPLSSMLSSDADIAGKLMSFLPMLQNLNKEDESTRLLEALRPFLSEQKRLRLDEASKMMKIMKLLPLLRSTGIL